MQPSEYKYGIKLTSAIKKDMKRAKKRGLPIEEFDFVVDMLRRGIRLPEKYCDHLLTGQYAGQRECHIKPNWLLIYYIEEDVLVLTLTRSGSHSDLFR